ncbi:MAG: TldD/PmbA family protein [Gemmatimonadaceae bacterium]|nr:TldD/PmbA family protein [Gemmatimonadaceae bacterium]MCW5825872.1 TldD/PmbA family protein [Gemmatimonadaceae bacterium]
MAPRSLRAVARHLSRAECEAITKRVLELSTADECRVTVNSGVRANTRFAVNQISTAGDNYNAAVSIRAVFGKKVANVTVNRLDDAALREAVQNAERIARLAPDDPELLPELGPQSYDESIVWNDATASLEPEARADAVRQITERARAAGLVSTGYLEAQAQAFAIANSAGLFAYQRSTGVAFTTTVRTEDGQGSGWAGASDNDFTRIDPRALAERAIEKARRSTNAAAIEPGRYTVVLEPTAAANLIQLIGGALNARNADEGRSFFSKAGGGNKIGDKVVDERVTLYSNPLDPRVPANTVSGDGSPNRANTWIENGVVKNLAYDRFWAQRTGKPQASTGGTLAMNGGTETVESMIASTQRGLLVTRFWYIRSVDPRTILFTGLTRDGTFLIENGRVTRPVKNLRYNESPIFMLNNLMAMGRPERVSASESGGPGQAIMIPAMKIRDFNFTSTSDAI